jgi:hypothetical protein
MRATHISKNQKGRESIFPNSEPENEYVAIPQRYVITHKRTIQANIFPKRRSESEATVANTEIR